MYCGMRNVDCRLKNSLWVKVTKPALNLIWYRASFVDSQRITVKKISKTKHITPAYRRQALTKRASLP